MHPSPSRVMKEVRPQAKWRKLLDTRLNTKQHHSTRSRSDFFLCGSLQEEELSSIPKEANMGLSCGNATKYANLKEVMFSVVCVLSLRVLRRSFHRAKSSWIWAAVAALIVFSLPKKVTRSCLLRHFDFDFDFLIFSSPVGPSGKVIGVDVTKEVLSLR